MVENMLAEYCTAAMEYCDNLDDIDYIYIEDCDGKCLNCECMAMVELK